MISKFRYQINFWLGEREGAVSVYLYEIRIVNLIKDFFDVGGNFYEKNRQRESKRAEIKNLRDKPVDRVKPLCGQYSVIHVMGSCSRTKEKNTLNAYFFVEMIRNVLQTIKKQITYLFVNQK